MQKSHPTAFVSAFVFDPDPFGIVLSFSLLVAYPRAPHYEVVVAVPCVCVRRDELCPFPARNTRHDSRLSFGSCTITLFSGCVDHYQLL